MNAKRILFFLILAGYIFIPGCNKNDSKNNGKLISLTIPADYYSYYDYVNYFANTPDGDLIYSEQINNGEEVVFEVNKENVTLKRFDLSRCFIKEYETYINITITSYIDILPFSLELKTTSSTYLGDAYVTFTDVPTYTSYLLANAYSNITTYYGDLSTTTFSISIYSDLPKGLLIRLNTGTGELYKFVDGLTVGQTTNISLSAMNSDFETAGISLNTNTYSHLQLSVDRYSENNFTSGSYSIFSSLVSTPISFSSPSSFLPDNYTRTYLYGILSGKIFSSIIYSDDIPNYVELLDGSATGYGSLPWSISYDFDINDQPDIVRLSCYHSSTFTDTYGFNVTWNVYVKPSSKDFTLPDIPEDIINYLSDYYGIEDLQFNNMELVDVCLYEYGKSQNFDDFINYYWSGWGDPQMNETNKYFNVVVSGKKNYYEPRKFIEYPQHNSLNPDY
ncbi:MAG: hypothetical protein NTZ85_02815 [Bacteroidia bacterium]|nr:hypothetical protein [Bacteroidia bacterium]